ncbi:MAG TPA: type II toxin-antitoxin system prevent-host-death family antitoxin [Candidatus Hydrogenedentes bacterium]|nr:type II toxin-antitoxin system prevent-host-death family antitoxin [Candidatus Hydrogenedentota bacterium]
MKSVSFTEFRKNASELFSKVEQGETLVVLRHGRPIAEVSPVKSSHTPAWKQAALRLTTRGAGLSEAILGERFDEDLF